MSLTHAEQCSTLLSAHRAERQEKQAALRRQIALLERLMAVAKANGDHKGVAELSLRHLKAREMLRATSHR